MERYLKRLPRHYNLVLGVPFQSNSFHGPVHGRRGLWQAGHVQKIILMQDICTISFRSLNNFQSAHYNISVLFGNFLVGQYYLVLFLVNFFINQR